MLSQMTSSFSSLFRQIYKQIDIYQIYPPFFTKKKLFYILPAIYTKYNSMILAHFPFTFILIFLPLSVTNLLNLNHVRS